jgi:uncharacterized protein (TIGR02266 family)
MSGVRVSYEGASGTSVEADALDISRGGLFIRTASPLAVGKRISVEIHVVGESSPWAALGRVVWARTKGEGDHAPPGMGVKLIDAEETVFAAIERMVDSREPTEPGVGKPSSPPPAMAPVVGGAPERERTLMGVGLSEPEPAAPPPRPLPNVRIDVPPPREQSIAIDLVSQKEPVTLELDLDRARAPVPAPVPAPMPPPALVAPAPSPIRSRPPPARTPAPVETGPGGGRWVVILLLLIVAGVAAYVLLDGFLRPPTAH